MRVPNETVRGRLELPLSDWNTREGLRDSAVLALLLEREGVGHLIFNRRRDDLPWHPGQICFPGGARDGDEGAVDCALRETCEEMGLEPGDIEVLGRLPERTSIAGFRVSPFVGRLKAVRAYTLAEDEVAEAFEVPCADLLLHDRWGYTETKHKLARFRKVPFFQHGERRIWGLTGIILRDFTTQLFGFAPPFG